MTSKSKTVKCLCLQSFGNVDEAVAIEERPLPPLKPNDVLVRMKASAINPSDIATIQGKYGTLPPLHSVLGYEGVGVIEEIGSEVNNLHIGQQVITPGRAGNWCEAFVTDASEIITLPDALPIKQCAMLSINPPTAWRMLQDFVKLEPGAWIIQNAANSAVGRAVIDIAHYKGWRTINIVRRPELVSEIKDSGGTIVIVDEDKPLMPIVRDIIGNENLALGINAVGGKSGTEVARCLSPHGSLVTYGAMSGEAMQVDNRLLIYQDIRFFGFWRKAWYEKTSREMCEALFIALYTLALQGYFNAPVEKTYPLTSYKEALQHALQNRRKGKILFEMNADS